MKYFFISLILLFAVSIYLHTDTAITQDLGRHLTLGKIIWQEKKIPTTNLFSYTYPDYPFTNHHWGSEVIFYLFDNYFSVNGLIILKVIIMILAFGVLLKFVAKRADFTALLIGSAFTLEILRERTEVRPEIFAYLIFVLFLVILYKEKENKFTPIPPPQGNPSLTWLSLGCYKAIWLLPVLQILWVNLHISFVYGLAVYFFFLIDRLFSRKMKFKYYVIAICLLTATLMNPFGWQGAIYPFTMFQNYGYSIVENQSPFFLEKLMSNPTIFYFKITALLFLLVTPLLLKKKFFFVVLSTFFFCGLSLFAIRNFPFFALSLLFPLALGLTLLREKFIKYDKLLKNIHWWKTLSYFLITSFFIWEIFSLVTNKYYQTRYSSLRFGLGQVTGLKEAVDFFLKNKLSGPIFNNFDIGSYLIYRLYPDQRVFVDGRPEGYPSSFFQEVYIPMQEKREVWNTVSEKYKFKTIIFSHTDITPWARQFLQQIMADSLWQLVYFDDYGMIWVKKSYLEEKDQLKISLEELRKMGIAKIQKAKESDALMRFANFYQLIGLKDLEEMLLFKLKKIQ